MKLAGGSRAFLSRFGKLEYASILRYLAAGIVLFGMVLRIGQYIANRSLWFDEAMLALNIVERSFGGLTQPLDYSQGAPIGFLFIQKAAISILGNRDYVLRLFPVLAGLAVMPLIYKVADLYLEGTGVFAAIWLFAVSDRLVYYASEAKQYSSDVAISVILLLSAYNCLKEDSNQRHFIGLALIGSTAMWISHPALFTIGAISIGLLMDRLLNKDWRKASWLGLVYLAWLVNFASVYFVSLRLLAENSILIKFWQDYFMPVPPWRDLAWFPKTFSSALENPAGLSLISIGAIAFFIGCLSLFFRRWQNALVLFLPFPAVLLASGLEKYPFGDRLLLFLVPSAFMIIAEGLERLRSVFSKVSRWAAFGGWFVLVVLLVYDPTSLALRNLVDPPMRENIKPVMSYVRNHRLNNDLIYIYYGAMPAFDYYAPQYGFGEDEYVVGVTSRKRPTKYFKDLKNLAGRGRVWFVFSHNCSWCAVNEEVYYLENLNKIGTELDEFSSEGASLYLFDLDGHE